MGWTTISIADWCKYMYWMKLNEITVYLSVTINKLLLKLKIIDVPMHVPLLVYNTHM